MASGGVLLSSPARPTLHDQFMMLSSSPDLPSLGELIAKNPKKPALRSGSRAAPIPENAVRSFTSATSIWRSAQEESGDASIVEMTFDGSKQDAKAKPSPSKTVMELSPETSTSEPKAAQGRKRKATSRKPKKVVDDDVEEVLMEATSVIANTLKKSKPAGDAADRQATIPKGKVTKASTKSKAQKPETVSKFFPQGIEAPKDTPASPTTASIPLELAIQRRTDWTPPRANGVDLPPVMSETREVRSSGSEQFSQEAPENPFRDLRDAYGCKETNLDAPAPLHAQDRSNVLGKRKLIESVSTRQSSTSANLSREASREASRQVSREVSPVKSKAPKKKPRTITELATAAYLEKPIEVPDNADGDSVLGLLAFHEETIVPTNDLEPTDSKTKKGRAKGRKPKKEKAEPRRQVVFSPDTAIKHSAKQDFVFGTSSQLVREHSPTLLRDLQAAIQASNSVEDDPFASPVITRPSRITPRNGLWSVGARDAEGELLNLEVIDLVDSPAIDKDDMMTQAILNPRKDLAAAEAERHTEKDRTAVTISSSSESSSTPLMTKSTFFSTQQGVQSNTEVVDTAVPCGANSPRLPSRRGAAQESILPPPSNQEQSQEVLEERPISRDNPVLPRPKYELFTDAQLAKDIRSYGFKPVKKRTAMIALLDQCWQSKAGRVLGAVVPHAALSTSPSKPSPRKKATVTAPATTMSPSKSRGRPRKSSSTAAIAASAATPDTAEISPKRPRGRPRKEVVPTLSSLATSGSNSIDASAASAKLVSTPPRKKAATQSTIEIADSDSEMVVTSSPFTSPEHTFSSPIAADSSMDGVTDLSLTMSPTSQQSVLFEYITKAVTSAPRTTDPQNPSWHEKMLMYDPIVLEDLAAWLNSGHLTDAGYDGEVAPGDVRKWCESKSICCLWRVNFHGKERKRF